MIFKILLILVAATFLSPDTLRANSCAFSVARMQHIARHAIHRAGIEMELMAIRGGHLTTLSSRTWLYRTKTGKSLVGLFFSAVLAMNANGMLTKMLRTPSPSESKIWIKIDFDQPNTPIVAYDERGQTIGEFSSEELRQAFNLAAERSSSESSPHRH